MAFVRRARTPLVVVLLCSGVVAGGALVWADRACQSAARGRIFRSVDAVPQNEVALVLGTSKTTLLGRANLHFNQRMDAAAALYRSGKVKHLLVSGDNHTKGYDEPSDMRDALIALGVPSQVITCDYAGFRTLDSVVRAKTAFGLSKFTIVSEEFHCPRAVWIARRHELNAVAFAAPDLSMRWSLRMKLREVFARAWCGIDLYVLHRNPKFSGPLEPILISSHS